MACIAKTRQLGPPSTGHSQAHPTHKFLNMQGNLQDQLGSSNLHDARRLNDAETRENQPNLDAKSDDEQLQPRYRRKRKRLLSFSDAPAGSCRMCGIDFTTATMRDAHEQEPHPFECTIAGCGKRFADEDLAIQHVDDWHHVHENERFLCEPCHEICTTMHDFELHRTRVDHPMDATHYARRVYVCNAVDTCTQVYKKKDKFMQHVSRYHTPMDDDVPFECDRCDAVFPTRHERGIHRFTVHPNQRGDHRSPSFTCEIVGCDKSYSKKEHLRRHVRTAHECPDEKPYQCDLCGVKFTHSHGLNRHEDSCHSESAERPYACSVCLLTFKKKSLLQAHAFVHTGVLPFECGDCGERFHKRFQLVRHERKHAASRPSQVKVIMCDVDDCDELLFGTEEKRRHLIETHQYSEQDIAALEAKSSSPVRRELKCLVCQRVFERMQNLRSHLRTHFEAVDERKLHVCPMVGCGKSYTKKSNIMAHYNAVHDLFKSKRFKCPYDGCDGAFGYKKVLVTHIASIHERVKKAATEQSSEWTSDKETKSDKPHSKRRRGREPIGLLARALGVDQIDTEFEGLKSN